MRVSGTSELLLKSMMAVSVLFVIVKKTLLTELGDESIEEFAEMSVKIVGDFASSI